MDEESVGRRVWIRGRVQGVGFRAATCEAARREPVAGWVRNLSDGRVEALFEGPAPAVEALLAWCRVGPPFARVDGLETRDEPCQGLREFRIR
jgi:acylphosphatase